MLSAITRDIAGNNLGRNRKAQIAGPKCFNHGWLRRSAWAAAGAAAAMIISFGVGRQAVAQTLTVIHTFSGGSDGSNPRAGVIRDASGNLYGTTSCCVSGTVFKIDPSWNETVLHSFPGQPDGFPFAGVIRDASGNLYGTTIGSVTGFGSVFKIDPSGNETVLHQFTLTPDGGFPRAGLVRDASGNLYGTTSEGGSGCCGIVFMIDAAGDFSVLHNFSGGAADGGSPWAGLVLDASSNLYGTTLYRGSANQGTVFKIDAGGGESVLHSFLGGADGAGPTSGLILDAAGNLYGTTTQGGSGGYGTVFKIDTAGNESVLYSFSGGADGGDPEAGLVLDAAGNLYGTTTQGGSAGHGTVFKIDTAGSESVLHSFSGGADGSDPKGDLILNAFGNLYGTTFYGGSTGYGTVFKITLSVQFSSFSAKLDTTAVPPPGFQLQAFFTQGTGAPAIDPVAQGLTLTVGSCTVTIPPGSFHQTKKGWWVYEGSIGGVALDVRISQTGANPYELQFEGSGVDLTPLTNPVTVTLALGDNTGATEVIQ